MSDKPACPTCRYWHPKNDNAPMAPCHRYPQVVNTTRGYHCGEYQGKSTPKAKPDAKPNTQKR